MTISRRTFLKRVAWSGAVLTVGGVVYPTFIEPHRVRVSRVPVRIRGLPRAFDGLTVAQLTDLHRSRYVSREYLDRCIDIVNAIQPDLIAFTGDYISHGRRRGERARLVYGDLDEAHENAREVAASLSRARAKRGAFASLGNHDHWYNAAEVTRLIEHAGIPVLRNASATVRINGEALPVVGLGDLWEEGVDVARAFANVDSPFALVLMHNPDFFEHWPRPGAHLILAGHTHGGQVNIPFVGPPVVPSIYGAKYAQGLFQRGDTQMYVSRGVGLIYPPVRFNCPPEIAVFQLRRA